MIIAAIAVNTFGGALGSAALVIFLVNVQGFPPAQVAVLMLISACAGFLFASLLGWLGDVMGSRGTLQLFLVGMGASTAALAFVVDVWQLAAAMIAFYVLDRGVSGIAAGLVATAVEPAYRAEARGLTRAYGVLGSSLGFIAAIPLVASLSPQALRIAILLDALTYLVAAAMYALLPRMPVTSENKRNRPWAALRDARFVMISALVSLSAVFFPLFTFAMPLWIPTQRQVPLAVLPILMLLSNLFVMLVQVPVSRRIRTFENALNGALVGGVLVATSFFLIWSATLAIGWLSISMTIVATLIFAAARAALTACQWTIAYETANEHAQGQYQSVFGTVLAILIAAGPSIYGPAVSTDAGWLLLALLALVLAAISYFGLRIIHTRSGRDAPTENGD